MKTSGLIKVLIVSDNHIMRSGLRRILESQSNIAVIGEISTKSGNMVDALLSQHPDIALVDLDPQGADALGFVRSVKRNARGTFVLVISDLGNDERARKALALGATGIVLKMQPPSVLIAAVQCLCEHNGGHVELRNLAANVAAGQSLDSAGGPSTERTKIDTLTDRERSVVALIASGLKNKEIGEHLHISDITVRHHLTNIFTKLGVSDRQKLLILAHQHGLAKLTLNREAS